MASRPKCAALRAARHAHDHVTQPPRDRRHRRRARLGVGEVDRHRPRPAPHRRGPAAARPDAPAPRDRLPEVLLVAQPLQPRAHLVLPVPADLLPQQSFQLRSVMAAAVTPIADSFRPRSVRGSRRERSGHHRARPAAARPAAAAPVLDRDRAGRRARRHRPLGAPRRRAAAGAGLPRARDPRAWAAATGSAPAPGCRRCCSTTTRPSPPPSRCAWPAAAPSPARPKPPCGRWPSSTR